MATAHSIPSQPNFNNLTGQTFCGITVLSYAGRRSKGPKNQRWNCRCVCGNEFITTIESLRRRPEKVCKGCYSGIPRKIPGHHEHINPGQDFGDLKAVRFLDDRRMRCWLCQCSCGRELEVFEHFLISSRQTHCGHVGLNPSVPLSTHRECFDCHKTLPLTLQYFNRHRNQKTGFYTYLGNCRVCVKNKDKSKRLLCLIHYSSDPPACSCCGEDHYEFLALDHITPVGGKLRKQHGTGVAFYDWLIRSRFPAGLRVLCQNCNTSLARHGYCPHQKD